MRVDAWVAKIAGIFHILGAVLLGCIVAIMLIGIGVRYVRVTLVGIDELSAILGVLMVFMGIAYVLREKKHVQVEVLTNLLSPRNRAISEVFVDAAMILICCVMIWQGFRLAIFAYVQGFGSFLLGFPLYIVRIVVLVGMILFLAEVLCHIPHTVRHKDRKEA